MEAIVLAKKAADDFNEVSANLVEVRELPITTDEEQEFAAEGVRWVKEKYAEFEEKRTNITTPMNVALREVNALFRPKLDALKEAERVLKRKIAAYLELKDAQNMEAIEAAAVAETPAEASKVLAEIKAVQEPAGIGRRYVWKYEVYDAAALPREFLEPAMWKIGRAVQDSDGAREIPGVRVFKEAVVSSRRVR